MDGSVIVEVVVVEGLAWVVGGEVERDRVGCDEADYAKKDGYAERRSEGHEEVPHVREWLGVVRRAEMQKVIYLRCCVVHGLVLMTPGSNAPLCRATARLKDAALIATNQGIHMFQEYEPVSRSDQRHPQILAANTNPHVISRIDISPHN